METNCEYGKCNGVEWDWKERNILAALQYGMSKIKTVINIDVSKTLVIFFFQLNMSVWCVNNADKKL